MMTGVAKASSSVSVVKSSLMPKRWKRPKASILAEHGDGSFGVLPHHHAASSSFEGFAGGRGLEEYLPGGALETAFFFERGSTPSSHAPGGVDVCCFNFIITSNLLKPLKSIQNLNTYKSARAKLRERQ
jgi:hypothetical protein